MTTLKEIRERFPAYNDLSDQQLADALHQKHYSDIPKEDFYGRIGFQTGGFGDMADASQAVRPPGPRRTAPAMPAMAPPAPGGPSMSVPPMQPMAPAAGLMDLMMGAAPVGTNRAGVGFLPTAGMPAEGTAPYAPAAPQMVDTYRPDIPFDPRALPQPGQMPQQAAPAAPAQPDPFAGESLLDLLKRRGQQFARGAGEIIAGIPEAAAIAGTRADIRETEGAAGLQDQRAQMIAEMQARLADPNLPPDQRAFIERNLADLTQGQEVLGDMASQPIVSPEDRPAYAMGDQVRGAVEGAVGAPDPRDTSFWGKLAEGGGSMAGFVAASLLGSAVGGPVGGVAAGATAGASVNAAQIYREAVAAGASRDEALGAARLAALLGSTEVVPIGRALDMLPGGVRSQVTNRLVKRLIEAGASGGEEAIQEAINGIGNNLIAKGIYDPERGVFDDVGEQALIGAILGGGLGAIAPAMRPGPNEGAGPARPLEPQDGQPDEPFNPGGRGPSRFQLTPPPDEPQAPEGEQPVERQAAPEQPEAAPVGETPAVAPPPAPVEEQQTEPAAEGGRVEILDEVETVGGETRPTGRKVRVNLDTGEVSPVEEAATPAPPVAERQPPSAPREVGPEADAAAGATIREGGITGVYIGDDNDPSRPGPIYSDRLTDATTRSIKTDPKIFQYKGGGDAEGVTAVLQGVGRFDPKRAGQVILYQRENGELVVADGHQRTGLARRAAAAGQKNVGGLSAVVYREKDGYTPQEVMVEAALANIGQGTGTAIDAARVFRNMPGKSLDDLNLPKQTDSVARRGMALSKLSDDAFGMVANGIASERDGGIVGRVVADKDMQADILDLLTKMKLPNEFQAESVARQAAEASQTETQTDMFGAMQVKKSLYRERANVLDAAIKMLRQDKRTFQTLVDRGATITSEGGNVLDQDANAARLEGDAAVLQYLTSQANRKGPISDALTQAAEALAGGQKLAASVEGFVQAVRRADQRGGEAGPAAPQDAQREDAGGRAEEVGDAPFNAESFQVGRDAAIEASRAAGFTHLDKLDATVEGMRGKKIEYVHDPKVKGVIRTVDNSRSVYVDWTDEYSANAEMAEPVKDGRKTVFRSTLGPADMKDYRLQRAAKPTTERTPEGEQSVIPGAEKDAAKSEAARKPDQRREVEARAQQSKMRTAVPQQDAGGLFDTQGDMLDNLDRQHATDSGLTYTKDQAVYGTPLDIFYSPLLRAVEGAKQKAAPGKDWLAILSKSPGVKKAEMDWLGVEDFLAAQDGQVTREELVEFIRGSQIQVVEERLGGRAQSSYYISETGDPDERSLPSRFAVRTYSGYDEWVFDTREEAEAFIRPPEDGAGFPLSGEAQFESYTESGGENYREILLRMPNLHHEGLNVPKLTPEDQSEYDAKRVRLREIETNHPHNAHSREDYQKIHAEVVAIAERYPGKSPFVQSAHFEQENIVVHARVKDRRGPNGERVLFVEEIQSDLGSKWREASESAEVTARREQIRQDVRELVEQHNAFLREVSERLGPVGATRNNLGELATYTLIDGAVAAEQAQALGDMERWPRLAPWAQDLLPVVMADEWAEVRDRHLDFKGQRKDLETQGLALGTEKRIDPSVPRTPFENENYYALMVKRLLRMAADEGYDRLSWTPGYMQAERWNAAAQSVVEEIEWREANDLGRPFYLEMARGHQISGYYDTAGVISQSWGANLNGRNIRDLVGPAVARRMLDEPKGVLDGQKITFPDSGYAIAYDQHIRKSVEKIAKKGGARVYTDKTLPDMANRDSAGRSVVDPVWSVDITDKLREIAREPLSIMQTPIAGAAHVDPEVARKALPRLRAELDRLNLHRVRVGLDESGRRRQGAFEASRFGAMDILIGQSLDPDKTLYHEAIHAMRFIGGANNPYGLFTPNEWEVLTREAERKWMEQYDIATRYPNLLPEERIEEAIAEAYADAAAARKRPSNSFIARAFSKMYRLFRAIRTAFKGLDADEVFLRAYAGEIGSRDAGNTGFVADVMAARNQFAGPQSATADIHALAAAKDRIARGERRERVRQETGWFQGPDKRWRYEISDDAAKVDMSLIPAIGKEAKIANARGNYPAKRLRLGDLLTHDKLYAAYPDLAEISVLITPDDFGYMGSVRGDQMSLHPQAFEDEAAVLSTVLHEVQHLIQSREGFARGGNLEMTAGVKAALRNMAVVRKQEEDRARVDYSDRLQTEKRARELLDHVLMWDSYNALLRYADHDRPSGVRRLILQHSDWLHHPILRDGPKDIQDRARDLYYDLSAMPKPHRMAERNAFLGDWSWRLAQLLRDAVPAEDWRMFQDDPRKPKSVINAVGREVRKARQALEPLDARVRDRQKAERLKDAHAYASPFEVYQALAGEVESRMTQARSAMTDAERQASAPDIYREAGVDPDAVIVVFQDGEIEVPFVANSIDTPHVRRQQPQRTRTDTPEFKRWFGDSKVVDENGEPLVVYHGTGGDFTRRNARFRTDAVGKGAGDWSGKGFYFTPDELEAQEYGPNVVPAYLSLQNPYVHYLRDYNWRAPDDWSEYLQKQGYDGVIVRVKDVDDRTGNVEADWIKEIVAFRPEQIKSVFNRGNWNPDDARIMEQVAYHGTPHDFDRFSVGSIGTGEGAQAYGWGLYFAGKREVAKYYRDALSTSNPTVTVDGRRVSAGGRKDHGQRTAEERAVVAFARSVDEDSGIDHAIRRAKLAVRSAEIGNLTEFQVEGGWGDVAKLEQVVEILEDWQKRGAKVTPGRLFTVEIPDDGDLLMWDAPLSEQPGKVKAAIRSLPYAPDESVWDKTTGSDFYEQVRVEMMGDDAFLGNSFYRARRRADAGRTASEALREAGIPGHRYLDQGSRQDGGGSYNYVIYDDAAVSVVSKDQAQPSPRPSRGPGPLLGAPHIPDRGVWDELTAANRSIWQRVKGGAAAAHDAADRARVRIQDRFLPVLRAQEAIERYTGTKLPDELNAYEVETNFSGKAGRHLDVIDRDFTKPILDIMAADKTLTTETVDDWLTALHARERNKRIASINKDMPDGGAGMSNAEADRILRDLRAGPHRAALEQISEHLDRLRERTLDLRVDAGLLSKDDADALRAMYKHYVPLKGFAETDNAEATLDTTGIGSRYSIRGQETQRAMGRRSRAFSPLMAAIVQAQEVAIRAEKNRVAQAVYRLAEQYPSKGLWEVKGVKQKRFFNKTTGMVETRAEGPITYRLEPNEMAVKVDGVEKRVIFHDERLARALGQVGADTLSAPIALAAAFNRFLSMFITTLDPEFIIRNAFRDVTAAAINISEAGGDDASAIRKGMVRNWRKAFMGAFGGMGGKENTEWQKHYKEFVEAGGKVHFFQMENPEASAKDFEKRLSMARSPAAIRAMRVIVNPKNLFSDRYNPVLAFVERSNLAVDNAVRLAAFVEARKLGWSPQKAANLAKNLTVNFNRRGSETSWLNALYLFFNAAVQGLQVTTKAMASKKGLAIGGGMVMLGLATDMMNAWLSDEDEDGELAYDKLPDYKSRMNWVLMARDGGNDAVTVPLPYIYAVFPYMGQQIGKVMRGVKSPAEALGGVFLASLEQTAPIQVGDFSEGSEQGFRSVLPTALQPVFEVSANMDWQGRPIRPEDPYGDYGPDAYKYFASVSNAARWMADVMNRGTGGTVAESGIIDVSPEYIDHIAGFLTGGAGRFVGRNVDLAISLATGEPVEARSVPMARQLVYDTGDWLDSDRYYRFRDEVRTAAQAVEDAAAAGIKASPEAQRLATLEDAMREAEKLLRETRKAKRAIDASKTLSVREKVKRKEAIYKRENGIFLAFNKRFVRIMGPQGE